MKYTSTNTPVQCFLTNNPCYKATRKMEVKGILWHSTGANNPNVKRYVQPSPTDVNKDKLLAYLGTNLNKNDWNHTTRQVGVNAFIGKNAAGEVVTVQTMPWDYRPWGCASGAKGSCNNGWIQFEICEDALTSQDYFLKCYKEACELTAYLCKMFNVDPQGTVKMNGVTVPTILCHADSHKLGLGNNHGDVLHWFKKYNKTMQDVRDDVQKLLDEPASTIPVTKPADPVVEVPAVSTPTTPVAFSPYIVRVTANSLNVRKGPATTYPIARTVKKGDAYTIVEEQNGFGKLKSGAGWIGLQYTSFVRKV